MLIGLWLVICFLHWLLYRGLIIDSFNLHGRIPSARERLTKCVMMLGMDLKMCLMRKVGISSGPAERLGFSFSTIFVTVFDVTC